MQARGLCHFVHKDSAHLAPVGRCHDSFIKVTGNVTPGTVRGLNIATGQHSSLCVSALVLNLGGSDVMEVDEQDREQVDSEGESRGEREREEDKTRTDNARSNM